MSKQDARSLSAGDFVQLILKHEWRLRGFIATLLGRFADIDEVVQNSLLVAWEKIDGFSYRDAQPDDEFLRWLFTIAKFQSLRSRQRHATSRLVFSDELIERLVDLQFDEVSYLESRRQALRGCIEKLPDLDRELIRGRYGGGRTVEQLAEQHDKTASAIYKALKRIRDVLQACIKRTMTREGF